MTEPKQEPKLSLAEELKQLEDSLKGIKAPKEELGNMKGIARKVRQMKRDGHLPKSKGNQ